MLYKLVIAFLSAIFISSLLFSQERTSIIANVIKNVKGKVFFKNNRGKINRIKNEISLNKGNIIYTGPRSSLDVYFEDKSVLSIGSLSVVLVDDLFSSQKPGQSNISYKSKFKLKLGSVKADVKRRAGEIKKFEIETPVGTASVRGTKEEVSYFSDSGMDIKVISGEVLLLSKIGVNKSVVKGEKTTATKSATRSFQKEIEAEESKVFKVSDDSASGSKEFKVIISKITKNSGMNKYKEKFKNRLSKSYKAKILSEPRTITANAHTPSIPYFVSPDELSDLKDYQKKIWNLDDPETDAKGNIKYYKLKS